MTDILEVVKNTYSETSEIVSTLSSTVPYLKALKTGYELVRKKRIEFFLQSLNDSVENLDEKRKRRFIDTIGSELGQQILHDYADATIQTSSPVAIAALALLYADVDHTTYSDDFKVVACLALAGLQQYQVDFFLRLMTLAEAKGENLPTEPYKVLFFNETFALSMDLRHPAGYPARASILNSLIVRGLLLPDHSTGRWGGTHIPFGIGGFSKDFQNLFKEAALRIGQEAAA